MVSLRCQLVVRELLEQCGIAVISVELGEVELKNPLSTFQQDVLRNHLHAAGFEILPDAKEILVEKIKVAVIKMVHIHTNLPHTNFSYYLAGELHHDYTYLANIFSEVSRMSIERYIILNRVERIKELLEYDELTLKEITEQLNYSSVSHLCNQFKKITGLTTHQYKEMDNKARKNIEDL